MGLQKILFLDRDGTLIREPADEQVDSLEKLELVDGVIGALLKLRDHGYRFVMVSNQDGLGTSHYPREDYEKVQAAVLRLFGSQGIRFDAVHICPHRPQDGCPCRKPNLGMVRDYIGRGDLDIGRSCVIGDRDTDLEMAKNMGLRGFRLGAGEDSGWEAVAARLIAEPRTGHAERSTKETRISVAVDLDGPGGCDISTGIGFFDHMLEQLSKHGGFALALRAEGDLRVDEHHTVEDAALCIGEALKQALGDKTGIGRYGFLLPMDEAEAQVSIDLSGRGSLSFKGSFPRERVGELPTELVPHFFGSLAHAMGATMHIKVEGENAHHMVEACFKGVARALRTALARSEGADIPSTKGTL
ncbi:MAG: bifunctional histidinol-phosphatase/imidazoleglycerol-phosphate dehydratase HisB [Elusimicrobiota bacterium]